MQLATQLVDPITREERWFEESIVSNSDSSMNFFLGWSLKNLNYTKSNKVITWIFATTASRVAKKRKILVTTKPKRV